MPNERIAFASFMNPRVPAVSRWWERESEVLASPPQLEYTSPLPEVAVLSRPAGKSLPTASAASFGNEGFAGPRSFNEVFTVWRLISGNHRELARGAGMFTSYAVAAAHAQSISGAVSGLSVTLVKHPDTGGYGWYGLPRITACPADPDVATLGARPGPFSGDCTGAAGRGKNPCHRRPARPSAPHWILRCRLCLRLAKRSFSAARQVNGLISARPVPIWLYPRARASSTENSSTFLPAV